MNLKTALDRLHYDFTMNELRLMNKSRHSGSMSYNSLLYLDLIAYKENCTASYLAEILHVAKSAVTLKVKELVKQGFLEKKQSETDRRVHYLSVRPEVAEMYKLYDNAFDNAVAEIEQTYDAEEVSRFCDMLDIFNRHFAGQVKREVTHA
ncbi:MAG: MarR family transcriptional regulator [Christensenella sp.]|nr:MarR family transcriptional regulator [Christensenella sp.]